MKDAITFQLRQIRAEAFCQRWGSLLVFPARTAVTPSPADEWSTVSVEDRAVHSYGQPPRGVVPEQPAVIVGKVSEPSIKGIAPVGKPVYRQAFQTASNPLEVRQRLEAPSGPRPERRGCAGADDQVTAGDSSRIGVVVRTA